MKKCKDCLEVKTRDLFYKHKGMKDCLKSECKECYNKKQRAREILNRKKSEELILMNGEVFKPFSTCGNYLVSNKGRVFVLEHLKNGVFIRAKFLKLTRLNTGYPSIVLNDDNGKRKLTVHRIVADVFLPNPNNYDMVNHKDSDRANNDVSNLEWCSREQNMRHAVNSDAYAKKLNRDDVVNIRASSLSMNELAKKYSVTQTNIRYILQKKTWKHF